MSQKLFRFSIENLRTKETTAFIGQGDTIDVAMKDGIKGANTPFRPKNDGKSRPDNGVMVKTSSGATVRRTLAEFESDIPHEAEEYSA